MISKIFLTVAHLRVSLSVFWSTTYPRAHQTAQSMPVSIVSGHGNVNVGVALKFAHALRTFLYLDPPLVEPLIDTRVLFEVQLQQMQACHM